MEKTPVPGKVTIGKPSKLDELKAKADAARKEYLEAKYGKELDGLREKHPTGYRFEVKAKDVLKGMDTLLVEVVDYYVSEKINPFAFFGLQDETPAVIVEAKVRMGWHPDHIGLSQ